MKNFFTPGLHVVASRLRDDPTLPIKTRLLALRASYTLRLGGRPDCEQILRRVYAERRRQLAELAQAYRVRQC